MARQSCSTLRGRFAQQRLELGEGVLDEVEVREKGGGTVGAPTAFDHRSGCRSIGKKRDQLDPSFQVRVDS